MLTQPSSSMLTICQDKDTINLPTALPQLQQSYNVSHLYFVPYLSLYHYTTEVLQRLTVF